MGLRETDLAAAQQIVSIMRDAGYEISPQDAYVAWEQHSEDWCASWLWLDGFPREDVVKYVLKYTKPERSA